MDYGVSHMRVCWSEFKHIGCAAQTKDLISFYLCFLSMPHYIIFKQLLMCLRKIIHIQEKEKKLAMTEDSWQMFYQCSFFPIFSSDIHTPAQGRCSVLHSFNAIHWFPTKHYWLCWVLGWNEELGILMVFKNFALLSVKDEDSMLCKDRGQHSRVQRKYLRWTNFKVTMKGWIRLFQVNQRTETCSRVVL